MDWELFVSSSSFMKNGNRKAGYTVVTQHEVTEGKALAPNASVQKAKLITLLRALELSEGKTIHM